MKKNYKEDFTAVIRMLYPDGVTAGIPDYDFDMHFTSGFTEYTAGRRDGQLYRCAVSDVDPTVLLVRFDNHGLHPCPSLGLRIVYHIPDSDFPDGFRDLPQTYPTDICLTVGASDIPTAAEISVILPYIKGEKGEKGEPGKDAAPYDDTEIRREIVGLWDATAEMQAKLADLYSTETHNLLKRLGYNDDDIEEYIWAVAHFDIPISLEQLRESVKIWENYRDSFYQLAGLIVAPKWTEEMEATGRQSYSMLASNRDTVRYIPHIATVRAHPFSPNNPRFEELRYIGGLDFKGTVSNWAQVEIDAPLLIGIGSITGRIVSFKITNPGVSKSCFKYIGKLKSSYRFADFTEAFYQCYQLTDLRGIDISGAYIGSIFRTDTAAKAWTRVPENMYIAPVSRSSSDLIFYGRAFSDSKFEVYMSRYDELNSWLLHWTEFRNCEINLMTPDYSDTNSNNSWPGRTFAQEGSVNKIYAPYIRVMCFDGLETTNYYSMSGVNYGVWEVDIPNFEDYRGMGGPFFFGGLNVTLFNIGAHLKTDLPISTLMKPFYFNSDSFVRSLRSWKSVPEENRPINVRMLPAQFEVIPEDVIADLTDKGFTISVV